MPLSHPAYGARIVDWPWFESSRNTSTWQNEDQFVGKCAKFEEAAAKSREARSGKHLLFSGMKFCCQGEFEINKSSPNQSVSVLEKLIEACGATVVHSVRMCDVAVIGERAPRKAFEAARTVNLEWVLEAITTYNKPDCEDPVYKVSKDAYYFASNNNNNSQYLQMQRGVSSTIPFHLMHRLHIPHFLFLFPILLLSQNQRGKEKHTAKQPHSSSKRARRSPNAGCVVPYYGRVQTLFDKHSSISLLLH